MPINGRVTKREIAEQRLTQARRRYREDLRELRRMGSGDGWPNPFEKAETGHIRRILKEAGVYSSEMDKVREFSLFMFMCGNYTPRKAVEERLKGDIDAIKENFWVECRPLPWWADSPW